MQSLILLVIALPFMSVVLSRFIPAASHRRSVSISIVLSWLTFGFAALCLVSAIVSPGEYEFKLGQDWGIIRFDSLSVLMATVISAISLIVHMYSVRYMVEEPGYARFFCSWTA